MGTHPDLICLSHIRWDFGVQRPHHVMVRFAGERRVFFVEEALVASGSPRLVVRHSPEGVLTVTPHLPPETPSQWVVPLEARCLDRMMSEYDITNYVLWFLTPMALPYAAHLSPKAIVWDCMDDLGARPDAPPDFKRNETALLHQSDVLFTGSRSLYETKRYVHSNIYTMPPAVDSAHFEPARWLIDEPEELALLNRPRIGFIGFLDDRIDYPLLQEVAWARPEWEILLIGPIVDLDPDALPKVPNLRFIDPCSYASLPNYLAALDVALLPFVRDESTRYLSPSQTPEYLAAGKPIASTSIRDVVHPYGEGGLVRIADTAPAFVDAIEASLREELGPRLRAADQFLEDLSWDGTYLRMRCILDAVVESNAAKRRPMSLTI